MGYLNMDASWRFLVDWTSRMAHKFGGTVREKDAARQWDWGQALCRELYGPDWMNSPQFREADRADQAPKEAIDRAERWEAGEWPEWVRQSSIEARQ